MKRLRSLAIRALSALGLLGVVRRWRRRFVTGDRKWRKRIARLKYRPGAKAAPGTMDVFHGDHWCRATVNATLRGRDIMAANLALAASIAERAGAPYSFVETASRFRYRIAIPRSHRKAVLDLIAASDDPGLHVFEGADYFAGHEPWTALPGLGISPPKRWRHADLTRVFRTHVDPKGKAIFGEVHGCEIEFWEEGRGVLSAPSENLTALRVEVADFAASEVEVGGHRVRTVASDLAAPLFTEAPFPVDLVYTWVDGSDPDWRRRKTQVTEALDPDHLVVDSDVDSRFLSRDELRYSLRSVAQFADFVNHIYLVTDRQVPRWLDPTTPGLTVVDHTEIFGDRGKLPTFNSHAIEARLHHISGLSEHYVYMNDDFLFGRLVESSAFFHANELAKFFLSPAVIAHEHLSVDRAANNARGLLMERFGRRVANKMKHAPYPQRRSVLEAMERDFPEAFERTASNQLRNPTDIPVASSMSHYYGFFTRQAVPATIANAYIDLGAPDRRDRLAEIAATRDYDVICLNDTTTTANDPERADREIIEWLETYYPVPSPWER